MKNFKDFKKSIPKNSIVLTQDSFSLPLKSNDVLFSLIENLADNRNAHHVILVEDADMIDFYKENYPNNNFELTTEKSLNKILENYEKIVIVTDEPSENTDVVEYVDLEKTQESDCSFVESLAVEGNFETFKTCITPKIRNIDIRRLMNDIRLEHDLPAVREEDDIDIDESRDAYFNGEFLNIGDVVNYQGKDCEVIERHTNHVTLEFDGQTAEVFVDQLKEELNKPKDLMESINQVLGDTPNEKNVLGKIKELSDSKYEDRQKKLDKNFLETFNPDDVDDLMKLHGNLIRSDVKLFARLISDSRGWLEPIVMSKLGDESASKELMKMGVDMYDRNSVMFYIQKNNIKMTNDVKPLFTGNKKDTKASVVKKGKSLKEFTNAG